jgi:hypothetical protein
VRVVKLPVEHGADGGDIAEHLAPVHRTIRRNERGLIGSLWPWCGRSVVGRERRIGLGGGASRCVTAQSFEEHVASARAPQKIQS